SSRLLRCVALDRFPHPRVRKAAAQLRGRGLLQIRVAGPGALVEERLGGENHAVQAEAALRRLLVDERALNRMRAVGRAETFERDDLGVADRSDPRHAGPHGAAAHDRGTRSALAETAAELRSAKRE